MNTSDGANNGLTLAEMRNNYQKYGAYSKDFIHCVRPPFKNEISDTDSEFIFCEIDYPDFRQVAEMLDKVILGELSKTAVSLWAESFLDLHYNLDNIDGYREISRNVKVILNEMLNLDDDEKKNEYNDVKDLLKKLSEEYILKGCE